MTHSNISSTSIPSLSKITADYLVHSSCIGVASQWSVLKASGSDVRAYLQGQISQDIDKLSDQQAIHSCILSPQGKAVSELYILAGHNQELIILTPSSHATATVARLRQFSLGHQLRIGVVDQLGICAIQGANTAPLLNNLALPVAAPNTFACARHPNEDTFTITMPHASWLISSTSHIETILNTTTQQISPEELESLRIMQGQALFGIEWDEHIHPLNANLVEFQGVDFNKGCYVGQEVTSRMHWRGGIKKKLYRVQIEGIPSRLPCAIHSTANIGTLKSASVDADGYCFGIALLPISIAQSEKNLTLENKNKLTILEPCHA